MLMNPQITLMSTTCMPLLSCLALHCQAQYSLAVMHGSLQAPRVPQYLSQQVCRRL